MFYTEKRRQPHINPGVNSGSQEEYCSCSTGGSRRVTVNRHTNHLRWKLCLLYQTMLLAKYIFSHQFLNSIASINNLVVSYSTETIAIHANV